VLVIVARALAQDLQKGSVKLKLKKSKQWEGNFIIQYVCGHLLIREDGHRSACLINPMKPVYICLGTTLSTIRNTLWSSTITI
jgi:hypothetical protein